MSLGSVLVDVAGEALKEIAADALPLVGDLVREIAKSGDQRSAAEKALRVLRTDAADAATDAAVDAALKGSQ